MMDKCREEFEKSGYDNLRGYEWQIWQAAWNARQPEVISREVIHKVVGDIVDGEEMWSAYDIASAIYALLTKGRGGAV